MGDQYTGAAVFAATFGLVYLFVNRISRQRALGGKSPPPSIGTLPLVGSQLYLPSRKEMHTFFAAKAQELGDVVSFTSGRRYTVVLNSHASLREAFVKRSTDFADRPKLQALNLTNPGQRGIVFHSYDADFKKYHQLSLSILKEFGFGQNIMETRISSEVQQLIKSIQGLNGNSFNPKEFVAGSIINVISSIVIGRSLENDDKFKKACFGLVNHIIRESQTVALEIFPLAKYLPADRRILDISVRLQKDFFCEVNREIDINVVSPTTDNFILSFIQHQGEHFDRAQLQHTIRDLIVAGFETSATTVLWALTLLADYPDVQRRLQEEIDSVVSRDRLPSLDDKQKLPYVEAAILEIMRYKTLVPLGIPHITMCDTEVKGHFIPQGTMVLPNLYAAHMDPNVWYKPLEFRPERFLDEGGNVIKRDMMISFSLGKRSCLGELLARQEVYLFITGLVQQFHIRPPEGQERIDAKDTLGGTLAPSPYHVRLVARTI